MTIYKVIDGKRYDCRSAQLVAEYEHLNRRDFGWYREELYRRKTGDFFIAGEGGPASSYRKTISKNEWTGGEKIIPLSDEEAKKWVEAHCDGQMYDLLFPENENPGKTTVSLKMSNSVLFSIKELANAEHKSVSETVEKLLMERLSSGK